MKLIKIFSGAVVSCFFMAFLFAQDSRAEKTQICFFELGNTKTSENFENKINNDPNVEINRYSINSETDCQTNKDNNKKERCDVKSAFQRMIDKMIEENKKCSALVISGHHTGDWFSDKYDKTSLSLKDMEQLSCLSENKDWFSNIKALWLDGCNTVTDSTVENTEDRSKTADGETLRVLNDQETGRVDNNEKDPSVLNRKNMELYGQSFAGVLDEYAPLSSRYLRMFPNTQIYGFNGAAPAAKGKKGGSQIGGSSFIYDHIINLGKALREEESSLAFQKGMDALLNSDLCDPETIEQWTEVTKGQAKTEAVENLDYKETYRLGCDLILAQQILDDPNSVTAQKALANQVKNDPQYQGKSDILDKANEILKNPSSEVALELAKIVTLKTLENIADKSHSHLLFNNIYDVWNTAKKYKTSDSSYFEEVQDRFQISFTNPLTERIDSPYIPLLKKGDYLKFYSEIHELKPPSFDDYVKDHINQLRQKAVNMAGSTEAKRALAVSVVDQLLQYEFLDKEQIEDLKDNQVFFPANTKNPFIKDIQLKLEYELAPNPEAFVSERLSSANNNSEEGVRVIKVGADRTLRQLYSGQINMDTAKERLEQFVQFTKVKDGVESASEGIFLGAFHSVLSSFGDEDKVDWIYNLSTAPGKENKLYGLMLLYAKKNLNKESQENLCKKMENDTRHWKKLICL